MTPVVRPVVRPEADHEWGIVAWLWPDFRHDLGTVVGGFPYADGRYQHAWLDEHPRPGAFWRRIAAELWGDASVETAEPVPGKPDLPSDHWIRSAPGR